MKQIKRKNIRLINADNRVALKKIKDTTVDSIVTDPPYGMSDHPDTFEMMKQWTQGKDYSHKSRGGFMAASWDSFVPQPSTWLECYRVLKPGGHCLAFFSTRTYDLGVLSMRLAGFEVRDSIQWIYGTGMPKSLNVGKKSNDTNWVGWGSNLKPACEIVVVCRKPFDCSITANVLKYGTGALNIDACRIDYASNDDPRIGKEYKHNAKADFKPGSKKDNSKGKSAQLHKSEGRWPTNVILTHHPKCDGKCYSDCPVFILDHQGNASRFFYCAKVTKKERNEGLSHPPDIDITNSGNIQSLKANINTSSGKQRNPTTEPKNPHPTVKPIKLMEYLLVLVTPKGGVVLDPFMGSGSTGCAALQKNFKFIGIEKDEQYFKIADARIKHWTPPPKLF